MYYVGVDLHKEQSWFYIMDDKGTKVTSKSIVNKSDALKGFFSTIPTPFTLAVEATYNWYFFVDIAEQYAYQVFLANSYELKAFAKRHKKTDMIDARLIADVLRKGFLPTVFIPDKATRALRELLHYRMNLVRDRCRAIFRLKNILDKLGADSTGDFTTIKAVCGIPVNSFLQVHQRIISEYIDQIVLLSRRIHQTKTYLKAYLVNDVDIARLIEIEGIDYFSAALIKTEIGDIKRFASFNRLCSFAGLAPKVEQSGSKPAFHGALASNRRKNLQWILLETVFYFIKGSPKRVARYEELKIRKGSNTAKVIMARQMLNIIYHVLKEQRPYYKDGGNNRVRKNQIQSVAAAALIGV